MSTVATDGKSMSGDGLATSNFVTSDNKVKVIRWLDTLVGVVGEWAQCQRFINWYISTTKVSDDTSVFYRRAGADSDYPQFDENFQAMVLTDGGDCYLYYEDEEAVKVDTPHAMGSGSEFAMGALKAGALPEEAIRIACELDVNSGGVITTCKFELRDFLDRHMEETKWGRVKKTLRLYEGVCFEKQYDDVTNIDKYERDGDPWVGFYDEDGDLQWVEGTAKVTEEIVFDGKEHKGHAQEILGDMDFIKHMETIKQESKET